MNSPPGLATHLRRHDPRATETARLASPASIVAFVRHVPPILRGGDRNRREFGSQLTRLPFETPAHTDELFESNARREAQARLHHLIELKGIGLLTGEVGSGKTTVCRHIAADLHPGLHRVGYVSLTTGNVLDMYKAIAWELGLPTERSRATA